MDQGQDPVVRSFREQISAADRAILDAVNRRIELVASLHEYKAGRGYPVVDRARESALLAALSEENRGPLSTEALCELYAGLIDLTKREVARLAEKVETP